jgi:uncharacterized protein
MILYLDTSVLLSLHLNDSKTEVVTNRLSRTKYDFAVSAWGVTEAASALGILVRRREVDPRLAVEVLENIGLLVAESQLFPVDADAYRMATQWLSDFHLGLRAGDALHTAICKTHDVTMTTTDRPLLRIAKKLRVKCLAL